MLLLLLFFLERFQKGNEKGSKEKNLNRTENVLYGTKDVRAQKLFPIEHKVFQTVKNAFELQ